MKTLRLLLSIIFISAIGLAFGQELEIYVSDAANFTSGYWKILKFDENGDNPETFIDDDIVWPQDIVFLEDQDIVLISNLTQAGYISKHNINTGEYVGDFATDINGPTRMKIGGDGLLYVLQWYNGNNKVLRYKLDGTFVDEFTSVGVPQSIGIDWDADGNLYVSSYSGDYVKKFDTDGNDLGEFISDNLVGPTNIWFEENGDLMVNDYDGGAVKRFSATGEFMETYITGLNGPEGVAFFGNGSMLLGNGGTSAVKMFDADGNFIEDYIPSGSGGLITPNVVVFRETSTVSVPGSATQSSRWIFIPASGVFQVNPDFVHDIKAISIINLNGQKVYSDSILLDGRWNPVGLPTGMYMAVAALNTGGQIKQKLIVNH